MRSITRRCAAALIMLALVLGAAMPSACAMVYGSIDRYEGKTLNIREDSTAYMTVGRMVRLRMTALAGRTIRTLSAKSFKSSKPSVVHVTPGGWVKALRSGKAKITMTAKDDTTYALTLTVIKSDKPTKLLFSESAVAARIGTKLDLAPYLEAKPLTALLESNKVIWKSGNTKVALVGTTGIVTPRKRGTATITASCGKLKATIKVKVKR